MDYVKRVYSQPNARSLKEGEEVVYLGKGKPLARYRKEGGQVWVSYMSTDGNLYVDKDFNVQGTINQGGTGGTGKPVVKGGLVPMTAGGMGANISANTGTMYIASAGTVSIGTLPVNRGGTATTANTTWINTNVTMNTDGTLEYDGSGNGAVTMNTLTDANDIRSRVTAGLASNGDVNRTVALAQGGFGSDLSSASGFLHVGSGTAQVKDADESKEALSLDAVANVDTRDLDNMNAGTLAVARGGTNAGNSNDWLNTRVKMQTDGTLEYDNTTDGAVTMNTLADDNNIRARVTGSLASGNGLNTGVAIGDGLESVLIWSDASVASSSDTAVAAASTIWQETGTSAVVKITFNYLHDAETKTIKVYTNALNVGGNTTTVTGGIHAMSAGVLSAQASGVAIVSGTGTTTSTTFTRVLASIDVTDGSKFSAGVLYKGQISLHCNAGTAKMTGAVVVAYGS